MEGEPRASRKAHVITQRKPSGSICFNQQILRRLVNILIVLDSDPFEAETGRRTVAHNKEVEKAGLIKMLIVRSQSAAGLQPPDRGRMASSEHFKTRCYLLTQHPSKYRSDKDTISNFGG
jgi:hypothetical protein